MGGAFAGSRNPEVHLFLPPSPLPPPLWVLSRAAAAVATSSLNDPVPPGPSAIPDLDPLLGPLIPDLPPPITIRAGDGALLSGRLYPGQAGKGVVLALHGSSLWSVAMHPVAMRLKAEGRTVYAPDLRGHGASGPLGDVAYKEQWLDDMADWREAIAAAHPGEPVLLLGHSQGGGFVLKVAGGERAHLFDAYLALSPFLAGHDLSLYRAEGNYATPALTRLLALLTLNGLGIEAHDGLPVIAYDVPAHAIPPRTRTNSWRLLEGSCLPPLWRPVVARIARPTGVLIGARDQLLVAPNYPAAIQTANPSIPVELLDALDHIDMLHAPPALARICQSVAGLLGV